ncbi:MAG: hypothetical protein CM15mP103_01900 [Gammaproteobacteria bacterium]|nr:MAG: hypothetical protein CM15mP103_01900 [Gammaproteobacteria bacterium]
MFNVSPVGQKELGGRHGATGKCLCGKVTYRLASKPLMLDVCHCKNCQRQAGASLYRSLRCLTEVEVEGRPRYSWMMTP